MIFSKFRQFIGGVAPKTGGRTPRIQKRVIAREDHTVSRQDISDNALKVLYRLNKAGFEAYLVGGGVRDVLLGEHPKDFDVATNARPEEVAKIFRNSRVIGRRFRLVHVLFGNDVVEVATFRSSQDDAPQSEHGMVLRDNVYGTLEDDAIRRDFTVNALYYNIADFSLVDFVDGLKDLKRQTLRLIGDPETRYREDPVRMLRAARFAAKLEFSIEPQTRSAILELAPLLKNVSNARLWDECAKLFLTGHGFDSFAQLKALKLLDVLLPQTAKALRHAPRWQAMFDHALDNTDERVAEGKGINPAFLFAVFLWPAVQEEVQKRLHKGQHMAPAWQAAASEVLDAQNEVVAIAKRFTLVIREMWFLQHRFDSRTPARVEKLLSHPRFRAAYDLLCLRAESEQELAPLADWWTRIQLADDAEKTRLFSQAKAETPKAEPGKAGSGSARRHAPDDGEIPDDGKPKARRRVRTRRPPKPRPA